ncbi:MAG: CRISPR-associated protein Cas4 [Bacteroidales bacterium]|nr:CRISPR-associated protein Cas4 [Bacteroidales bacterium]
MKITGTHFNYFQVCHRKLWLFANNIQMEHNSELVLEGKLIHETTYPQRPARYQELEIDGIKIDYFDTVEKVIHEIKKTEKLEHAHEWQLKYYIYVLKNNGIEGVTGILEYPKTRQRHEVFLSEIDEQAIEEMKDLITEIMESKKCPPLQKKSICKNCSYFDLCFSGEQEEPTS